MTTVLDTLIETMNVVENNLELYDILSGEDKKEQVMYMMEVFIISTYGNEIWEKWETILPLLIDFIVKISKNQVILKLNQDIHKIWRRCC